MGRGRRQDQDASAHSNGASHPVEPMSCPSPTSHSSDCPKGSVWVQDPGCSGFGSGWVQNLGKVALDQAGGTDPWSRVSDMSVFCTSPSQPLSSPKLSLVGRGASPRLRVSSHPNECVHMECAEAVCSKGGFSYIKGCTIPPSRLLWEADDVCWSLAQGHTVRAQ